MSQNQLPLSFIQEEGDIDLDREVEGYFHPSSPPPVQLSLGDIGTNPSPTPSPISFELRIPTPPPWRDDSNDSVWDPERVFLGRNTHSLPTSSQQDQQNFSSLSSSPIFPDNSPPDYFSFLSSSSFPEEEMQLFPLLSSQNHHLLTEE